MISRDGKWGKRETRRRGDAGKGRMEGKNRDGRMEGWKNGRAETISKVPRVP